MASGEHIRVAHDNDQHVVPVGNEPPHDLHCECWCSPRVDEGVPHRSGSRVWIHHRLKDHIAEIERRIASGAG